MLDEQIRRVLLGYEPLWAEKELNIDLALEATQYYGSKSLLAQVWSNLIDNAIKFSRQGGSLFISCWEFDGKVVVRIRDTGIGMSADALSRVFEPFFRVAPGERQGTGLGLSIVRRLCTRFDWRVELNSVLGQGTTATVHFH